MMKKMIYLLLLFTVSGNLRGIPVRDIDSLTYRINTRMSFYTSEKNGEALLHIPSMYISNTSFVLLLNDGDTVFKWRGIPGKNILRLPFLLPEAAGKYTLQAEILLENSKKYHASTELTILQYKPNEVKCDLLTGGLVVNNRQFFPFGFYCYSPVDPLLPEEEVVKGFNMISPYQKIIPETFDERKSYMDRCARLGMKVHYNLLSVSGGGGVGSEIEGLTQGEKMERLLNEVKTFMNHPALLAWYICDEPTGNRLSQDSLKLIYNTVKMLDPWHPVSVVFMAPFLSSARKYSEALDIVMADPYPVPGLPVRFVGNVAEQLSDEYKGKKPVWIVTQAFGGGEIWEREPTLQEIRSMTYQSIIKGARGIQYFVRQGLNLFPKSTATWGECGRMAVEIAEMTPWLLSDENTIAVRTGSTSVLLTSAVHNGQLLILAVNTTNATQKAEINVARPLTGKATVLFENRIVPVNNGYLTDYFAPFGTKAFLLDIEKRNDTLKTYKDNLILDPGFEDTASPGIPSACYARGGSDRGATYFLDTREHLEGNHSVRLVAPTDNGRIRLRFFPFPVRKGSIYMVSVWAKTEPYQVMKNDTFTSDRTSFKVSLGDSGSGNFKIDHEWKLYTKFIKFDSDDETTRKSNIILQMSCQGVAWFDMLQVVECSDINRSINPALKGEWQSHLY